MAKNPSYPRANPLRAMDRRINRMSYSERIQHFSQVGDTLTSAGRQLGGTSRRRRRRVDIEEPVDFAAASGQTPHGGERRSLANAGGPSHAMLRALQDASGHDPRALNAVADLQVANPRKNPYFSIEVEHLPTRSKVQFDGWVTNFADNFTSQWNGTPAYGRMDDMYTFQRTGRKISLAFDVVAVDKSEATLNQHNMNRLAQFLYPVYSSDSDPQFQVLTAAPLLRMKYSGLVANARDNEGLVGFLQGFSYAPNVAAGPVITTGPAARAPNLLYKEHSVQLEFTVLHTHKVGWGAASNGVGGSKYSFGDFSEEGAKNFPHALAREFDPGSSDEMMDQYVNKLPNPQRSAASMSLENESAERLAKVQEQQRRQQEQDAARQAEVLDARLARRGRQNRRWERNHPRKVRAGERGHPNNRSYNQKNSERSEI